MPDVTFLRTALNTAGASYDSHIRTYHMPDSLSREEAALRAIEVFEEELGKPWTDYADRYEVS